MDLFYCCADLMMKIAGIARQSGGLSCPNLGGRGRFKSQPRLQSELQGYIGRISRKRAPVWV